MSASCKECKHYHPLGNDGENGQCRKFPPKIMLIPDTDAITGKTFMAMPQDCFPPVQASAWCSEYRKALEAEVVDREFQNMQNAILGASGTLAGMESLNLPIGEARIPVDDDPTRHDKEINTKPEVLPIEPLKAGKTVLPNDPCPCGKKNEHTGNPLKHKHCDCEQYH